MKNNTLNDELTELTRWKALNRGAIRMIANRFARRIQTVSAVLHKKYYSPGGVIEGALADLGAPGMKQRQTEARLKYKTSEWTSEEIVRLLRQAEEIQARKTA